jgi:predicted small lipoprotein YifL
MSNRVFRTRVAALVVLALAACSGGSSPLVPDSAQRAAASQHQSKIAKAQIFIHWRSKHRVEHTRRAFFISPSAKSIWISVSPVSKPNVTSVKIVNRGSSPTSTVSLDAPTGSDVFTFQAYDRPNAIGNNLGGATVQQKIVAGETNTVRATLEGYASTFDITSDDGRFAPFAGSANGYTVAGEGQYAFSVAAVDADGNVILSPGAPKVSATSDTSYFAVSPVKGKTNTFTIQALALVPSNAVGSLIRPQLVMSAPGAGSLTATEDYALNEASLLYVVAGTGSSQHIYAYDSLDNEYPIPAGAFSGLSNPVGLVYDPASERIYVADAGTNSILAFDENGTAVSGWSAPSVPGITGITFSAHTKELYASSTANGGQVLIFNTNGGSVNLNGGFTGLHGPPVGLAYLAVALDAAGSVSWPSNTVAVVESSVNGNPGHFDVYGDDGTYYPSASLALTNVVTGNPFNPTGIGVSNVGSWLSSDVGAGKPQAIDPGYWITGADVGTTTPVAAVVCYHFFWCYSPSISPPVFLDGNEDSFFNGTTGGGATVTDISAPTSVVMNPVTGDTYVINGPGGVPKGGLSGFVGGIETPGLGYGHPPAGMAPVYLGEVPVDGDAPIIGPPAGVSNFTAAAFTEF